VEAIQNADASSKLPDLPAQDFSPHSSNMELHELQAENAILRQRIQATRPDELVADTTAGGMGVAAETAAEAAAAAATLEHELDRLCERVFQDQPPSAASTLVAHLQNRLAGFAAVAEQLHAQLRRAPPGGLHGEENAGPWLERAGKLARENEELRAELQERRAEVSTLSETAGEAAALRAALLEQADGYEQKQAQAALRHGLLEQKVDEKTTQLQVLHEELQSHCAEIEVEQAVQAQEREQLIADLEQAKASLALQADSNLALSHRLPPPVGNQPPPLIHCTACVC
jgi:hypothetical protein